MSRSARLPDRAGAHAVAALDLRHAPLTNDTHRSQIRRGPRNGWKVQSEAWNER